MGHVAETPDERDTGYPFRLQEQRICVSGSGWGQYERKIAAFYVGTLWDRPLEPASDDMRLFMPVYFLFRRRDILLTGYCSDDLCLFSYVFKKCEQTGSGEPEISEAGDEDKKFFYKKEERMGYEQRIPYL